MGNFQKWPKSAKMNFLKCAKKILDLAKDITKEIKQDKIRPYKYYSPQKMGYNEFGGKVGPNSFQVLFCKEKDIKMARNHNKVIFYQQV